MDEQKQSGPGLDVSATNLIEGLYVWRRRSAHNYAFDLRKFSK